MPFDLSSCDRSTPCARTDHGLKSMHFLSRERRTKLAAHPKSNRTQGSGIFDTIQELEIWITYLPCYTQPWTCDAHSLHPRGFGYSAIPLNLPGL